MRVKKHKDTWYFSTGLLTDHTQAIYYLDRRQLHVVELKHLPKILQVLKEELGLKELQVKW